MPRSSRKSDRIAFILCSALAIAGIVGVWVWNVRSVVEQGMSGARQVISDVSQTAGDVKQQSAPDPETTAAIKAGIHAVLNASAEEKAAQERQDAEAQATVDAVAEAMSEKMAEDGESPEGSEGPEGPEGTEGIETNN